MFTEMDKSGQINFRLAKMQFEIARFLASQVNSDHEELMNVPVGWEEWNNEIIQVTSQLAVAFCP